MRTLALVLLLVCVAAPMAPARDQGSMHTANWIQSNLPRVLEKQHMVKVSFCRVGPVEQMQDGLVQWVAVCTEDWQNNMGGWINVRMSPHDTAEFLKRYRANLDWKDQGRVKARELAGVVRLLNGSAYLDLFNSTEGPIKRADPETIQPKVRTWTALDGRTIDAEYLSATDTHVKFRRVLDGQVFDYELARLSEADRAWVAQQRGR